jgi:hypothetical protein
LPLRIKSVEGVITLAQEGRFELVTDNGRDMHWRGSQPGSRTKCNVAAIAPAAGRSRHYWLQHLSLLCGRLDAPYDRGSVIRAAAITQGLLGNVERPGGGIRALRGYASIQGSIDIPTLCNMLPTYLPQPNAFKLHQTLKEYLEHERTPTGWWHNFPKHAVSLLKAWHGDAARTDNDFGFAWLARIVGDHSQLP